ncbi:hypothetical protein Tco_1249625, partial [Tanacetum coccineum]
MMNSDNWLFFFKFSSKDGMDAMFENVPTGRYVVPTGKVIATVSIKVPTG